MGKKHSEYHGSMNYDEKERLMITHYFGLLAEKHVYHRRIQLTFHQEYRIRYIGILDGSSTRTG